MDIVLPFVQTHARSRGRGCSYKSQRRQRDLVYATKYPSQDGPKTGLRLLELTTGNAKWLVPEIEPSLQGSQIHWTFGLLPNAAFTPDSKAVIASYHGKLWRIEVPSGVVHEIKFTAEVEQDLGPLNRFPREYNDTELTARVVRDVRRSPDGKQGSSPESVISFQLEAAVWRNSDRSRQ